MIVVTVATVVTLATVVIVVIVVTVVTVVTVAVWDEYSDIQIYSNIFRQIYSFVQIFVNFFQGEYIRIFIRDLFMLTNIFGYSFVQYL